MASPQDIQLAIEHQGAGRFSEAEAIYRKILQQSPDEPNILQLLSMVQGNLGRFDEALESLHLAIAVCPDVAEFHNGLGSVLRKLNRWDEAIESYRRALELRADFPEASNNLGIALWFKGRNNEAIAAWEHAVQIKPDLAQVHCNLGNARKEMGQLDESVAAYQRALQILPDFAEAYHNLGNVLQLKGEFEQAIEAYRQAVRFRPTLAEAFNNLGNALRELDHLDEAITATRRAIELNPRMSQAHNSLGNALKSQCRFDEAIVAYKTAIEVNPRLSVAHVNLAQSLLARGDFEHGWPEYEWRWALKPPVALPLRTRRWDGRELVGATILLHAEGGFGDAIHFARYVPMVVARGGRVILQCRRELKRLMETMPGVERFCALGEAFPQFDVQCPLLSLPLVFRTTLETIPADIPYLSAIHSRNLEGSGLQIGLAWAGTLENRDARNRHIPASALSPLAKIDATFHSLQVGPAAGDFRDAPELKMIGHSHELNDFAETAALIAALDLVITVDTAVAHLAGAMGKTVWLLLSTVPEWRWLLDRDDSPWYPTMRLFRQKSTGDWSGVVSRVVEALR